MKTDYFYVYILNCENGNYYTGYTTDIARRYQEHVTGSGKCKYTRSFKPLGVAQCWKITENKSLAMQAEKYIKSLSKREKQLLISDPALLNSLFPCSPIPWCDIENISEKS